MKEEDLNQLLSSIKETIGDEAEATIADTLGTLRTMNSKVIENLNEKDKEISRLKDTNEKLIKANGSLLMQIPTIKKEEEPKAKESEPEYFDYRSVFDENGNIK